jgi:anti-sigma factor RsiW
LKQGDGTIPPESLAKLTDRELWRRSRAIDMAEDDAEHYLDLAGFADGLLDPDDQERVAERLAEDPAEAADISAARALSGAEGSGAALPEAIFARAAALISPPPGTADNVVWFAPQPGARGIGLPRLARWGSLAAAVALASWLGFTLGMDMSRSLATGTRNSDDGGLNELFDPTARLIRDLTDTTQA